jgi:hypothetical protein
LQVVEQAARRGDDDVDALAQPGDLGLMLTPPKMTTDRTGRCLP